MSFIDNRNYLLSLLPKQKSDSHNYDESQHFMGGKLLQNQPNPFSGKTTIKYLLLKAADVSIIVYSNNGTVVRKFEFDNKKGSHFVELDLNDLPAGLYYYSLVIEGQGIDSKKMLMIK